MPAPFPDAPRGALPALVVCLLLVAASVGAQTPSSASGEYAGPSWTLVGGVSAGPPANLYQGDVLSEGVGVSGPDGSRREQTFVTEYTERMGARTELWGGLTHHLFDEHFMIVRGRVGTATSEGTYLGGGALEQTFDRRATWFGADVLFAARLIDGPRFNGSLVVGPSLVRYSLDMSSGGRDVIARKAGEVLGVDLRDPVAWSDRSWLNLSFVLGFETRFRLSPAVGLTAGLDGRILRTTGSAFEDEARSDIEDAIGGDASISYQGYSGWAPTLTVGLEVGLPGSGAGPRAEGDDDEGTKKRKAGGVLPGDDRR